MKYSKLLFVAVALFTACERDPTNPDITERFYLTSYFGRSLPLPPLSQDPFDPSAPPMCGDTLVSYYLELAPAGAARSVETSASNCAGRAGSRVTTTLTGRYTVRSDTIDFKMDVEHELLDSISFFVVRSGNQLRRPFTVYSEADPQGGQQFMVYTKH